MPKRTRTTRPILAALLALFLAAAGAEAQYFGKNKVQYNDFDWRVLKTTHFEVYYYESEREAVMDVARMAERSYARLSQVLGYDFDKPIPLILYASHSQFQQTNVTPSQISEGTGGMTDLAKRRLTIPFTGSYAEMEHVVTHEMVHAFQLDILYGGGGSMVANTVGFSPPLWFMEGMAEYFSIDGVDRHTEMWMRDAALQGYLIPIPVLSRVYDIRVYRFGQSIMNFLARTYGEEKIGEILRAAPRVGGVERAFQAVLGVTLEKFSDEWLEEVRRTYLPQIVNYAKPEKFARPITSPDRDRGSLNLAPAVSPGGDRVAFISDRDMYSSLYIADTDDPEENAEKLIEGERTGSFESLRFFNTSISWSPDERFLAFPAKVGGHDAIYIYDVERRRVHRKLDMEEFDAVLSPSWSPDGTRLVFTVIEGGRSNLFTVRADGTELTRLTDDRYTTRDPAWSPDGRTIAFTTDRGEGTDFEKLVFEGYKIALYHLEEGTVEVLPNMPGKNIAPQWAPGGEDILFVSDRSGISNLFSMELKTGEVFRLTNILTGVTGIIPESSPISLSRNGETLVFSAFSRGRWDLYNLRDPLLLKHIPFRREEEPGAPEPPVVAALDRARAEAPPVIAFSGGADRESPYGGASRSDAGPPPLAGPPEPDPAKLVDLRSYFPEGEAPEPEDMEDHIRNADGVDALPDTADFEDEEYDTRFSQDFLFGGAAFASNVGFLGQSAVSFSDILGNHNLTFAAGIYGSLSDADLYFAYTNLRRRLNWSVALFQYRNDYYIYTAESEAEFESQIYRGVQLMMSRPFSKYRRIDFGLRGESITSSVFRTSFYGDTYEEVRGDPRYFAQPFLSYVTDNVIYGTTGPINGSRSRISLDYAFGDLSFGTGIVDARKYWNIRRRYSVAFRLLSGASVGRDLQFFRIGGPYTFRGIDYGDLRATRVGMANLEFRYPLIEQLRLGWPLPLDLRSINGVFFLDGAAGWYGDGSELAPMQNRPVDPITGRVENAYAFAYGFGARVNLGIFILRWDWGQRTDFQRTLGPSQNFFTLAADF